MKGTAATDEITSGCRSLPSEAAPLLYLIAVLCPPLAVLMSGKIFQSVLNLVLTLFFWVPGVIHALAVVADHQAERRNERLIAAMAGHRYR